MRLEATDIYAGYGKIEVLHGATIRADKGEIICIIGPNGSGKSTLLKTVFGLLKPTKGTVCFDGRDITRLEPEQKVRLGIAFIPQGRNVFPSLTVRENLEMGGTALDDEKAVRRAIEEALESYPLLKRKIRDKAGNLSGGEKQILSLARADMVKPGLILMDEPSIGLSPRMIDEVYVEDRGDQPPGHHLRHRRTERPQSPLDRPPWLRAGSGQNAPGGYGSGASQQRGSEETLSGRLKRSDPWPVIGDQ